MLRPRLELVAAAILFSTGGAAIKASALNAVQVAGFRSLVAAIFFLLAVPAARRAWSMRATIVGCFYGGSMITYVIANKLTTSANAIFLQDTAPFYVLLFSPLILGEIIRRRDLAVVACMLVGMSLFFYWGEAPQDTAPNPLLGNVIAMIGGVAWAGTVIGLRLLRQNSGTENAAAPALVIGNILTFAGCAAFAVPVERANVQDVAIIVFLGVFQVGCAYMLLTRAVAHVPALEAVLLLLIEPVINPLWSFLLHGEVPGTWALVGGAIILLATTFKSAVDARGAAAKELPRPA